MMSRLLVTSEQKQSLLTLESNLFAEFENVTGQPMKREETGELRINSEERTNLVILYIVQRQIIIRGTKT
jgi:hypothetical protein